LFDVVWVWEVVSLWTSLPVNDQRVAVIVMRHAALIAETTEQVHEHNGGMLVLKGFDFLYHVSPRKFGWLF